MLSMTPECVMTFNQAISSRLMSNCIHFENVKQSTIIYIFQGRPAVCIFRSMEAGDIRRWRRGIARKPRFCGSGWGNDTRRNGNSRRLLQLSPTERLGGEGFSVNYRSFDVSTSALVTTSKLRILWKFLNVFAPDQMIIGMLLLSCLSVVSFSICCIFLSRKRVNFILEKFPKIRLANYMEKRIYGGSWPLGATSIFFLWRHLQCGHPFSNFFSENGQDILIYSQRYCSLSYTVSRRVSLWSGLIWIFFWWN